MKKILDLDWEMIFTEIIFPHFSTIIINLLIFCPIAFILSLIYIRVLRKKQVFVRQQKYYNWFVKLYIPVLIIVFLYFSVIFALIYSSDTIIKKEEPRVVSEIYDVSVNKIFESQESRYNFIQQLQERSLGYKKKSEDMSYETIEVVSDIIDDFNITSIDNKKITNYFIKQNKTKLYNALLDGLQLAAGTQFKNSEMTFTEINKLNDAIDTVEPKKVEKAIKSILTDIVSKIITSQIKSYAIATFFIFLLIIFIPVLEWLIYSWYMKRKIKTIEIQK